MKKDLIDRILKTSETIHKSSTKGLGDNMVVSSAVANILKGFRRGYRKGKIKKLFPDG